MESGNTGIYELVSSGEAARAEGSPVNSTNSGTFS